MGVTKAIIPAAGLGTRFLPYTKVVPKEMLPLINFPAIHYIAKEAISSDIKHFSIITSRSKSSIADYFDISPSLENELKYNNKEHFLREINYIIKNATFSYIRQNEPLGLAHAIRMARESIGKEYFGVLLPDDIIVGQQAALDQLIQVSKQEKASIIAVQEVPQEHISNYGVISIKKQLTSNLFQVKQLVEKPERKDAPSNLAIVGRYVLSHKIFAAIDQTQAYATEELQLTDSINIMMKNNEKVYAYKVQGDRFDIGTPLGFAKAIIHFSLQNPLYGKEIRTYLNGIDNPSSTLISPAKNIPLSL